MNIKVIHRGIDYAVLQVGKEEFEVSHALATAIQAELRKVTSKAKES